MSTLQGRETPHAPSHETLAWVTAIALWGVADVLVTAYGLDGITVERHPGWETIVSLVWTYGPWDFGQQILWTALVIWKGLALGVMYGLYRLVPRAYRVGVPIGLTSWGLLVLVWNAYAVGLV